MEAPAVPNLTLRPTPPGRRDLAALPKAPACISRIAMRPSTMIDMARTQGMRTASPAAHRRGLHADRRARVVPFPTPTIPRVTSCAPRPRCAASSAGREDDAASSVRMEDPGRSDLRAPSAASQRSRSSSTGPPSLARYRRRYRGDCCGVTHEAPVGRARAPGRVVCRGWPRRVVGWPVERRARGLHGVVCSGIPHRAPRRARGRSARRRAPGSVLRARGHFHSGTAHTSGTGCAPAGRTQQRPSWTRYRSGGVPHVRTCTWAMATDFRRCRCRRVALSGCYHRRADPLLFRSRLVAQYEVARRRVRPVRQGPGRPGAILYRRVPGLATTRRRRGRPTSTPGWRRPRVALRRHGVALRRPRRSE